MKSPRSNPRAFRFFGPGASFRSSWLLDTGQTYASWAHLTLSACTTPAAFWPTSHARTQWTSAVSGLVRGVNMTELTVMLILRTERMSLNEITLALGVPPSSGFDTGELPFDGRLRSFQTPRSHTAWILDSTEASTSDLSGHLQSLADRLPADLLRERRPQLPTDLRVELNVALLFDGQAGFLDFERSALGFVDRYEAVLVVSACNVSGPVEP
jgi:hypothetical protein